jgi:PAS domain S-box-containing protein
MQRLTTGYQPHILALFFLFFSLVTISACRKDTSRKLAPEATKGILDLTDWDFKKDGPVQLKGDWEFFWQQHLGPALARLDTPLKPHFVQVPDYWNNYVIEGEELPGEGYATYRLTVLLNEQTSPMALRLMEVSSAYTLFINSKNLASAGLAGISRDTSRPKWFRQAVSFEASTGRLEIVLLVANFHHRKGGMWEVSELGRETDIRQLQQRSLGFDLFLFGSIVIMGLYHLGLFVVRRKDRSPLYFSIFCFLIALRLSTTSERFLIHLLSNMNWETAVKLEYLSFYLAIPAFALFMKSLFPKFSKRFLYIIALLSAGFSFIVLITQAIFYSHFINLYEIFTVLTIAYALYVILISFKENRMEAFVFLLGFTILALTTINDILYVERFIETGHLAPFGFFVLILSQALLLSFRFSNALATVESQDLELRTTLEAMQQSEEKHRTILNSIEEGYYEVNPEGDLTFFNDSLCEILGYPEDELDGMNYRQFMGAETAKQVRETFNKVYRSGKATKAFDWESISKDGEKKYIETSVSSMLNSEGKPIGLRGVARDVTERKKSEEQARLHDQQLMHASKMVALGSLVSGVAHEINNPNNFIMLNSPLLKEAWENAMPVLERYYEENGDFIIGGLNYSEMRENIPDLFTGITEGSKRIKQIVDDLKNYVRDDTADLTQAVDINAVIMSAVTLVSNMIKESTNRFDIGYGKNLPLLQGNFQRLEQVVINLVQNACQALTATDQGIFISTSFDESLSRIRIRVKDEGAGMTPETLSRITDPFFTTRQKSGGVGLGLSISSRMLEEHGGSIHFESQPGGGTTVDIILPVER